MQYLCWCKKRTSQYGAANFPVSCSDEYGRIWKCVEIRAFFFPLYRVCTKAISISKGSYVNEEPKNVIFVSVQKAHFRVWGC